MSDTERPSELTVEEVKNVVSEANEYEKEGRGVRIRHGLGFSSREIDDLIEAGWKFRVSNVGDLIVWPRPVDADSDRDGGGDRDV
jgi:hypothetical protein